MKTVTAEQFFNAVHEEVQAMKEHGTSYRFKTAQLSLEVLKERLDVSLYRNRKKAYEVAASVLKEADQERLLDVAQSLNALLVSMERKLNATDDFKALVASRMKSFRLVPVK